MNWKETAFTPSIRINFCGTNVMSVCNATERDLQKYCRFYVLSDESLELVPGIIRHLN